MLGSYLNGARPKAAKELLESKEKFKTSEAVSIRDALATQLLLGNAKRAGDISKMYLKDVEDATLPAQGQEKEIFVSISPF